MMKCPNCGSIAQVRVKYVPSPNPNRITRQSICGDCGCITNSVFALATEKTWAENGTLIKVVEGSE